ncbi:serine/threonine-protein kinase [Hyalangium gracile]|uniref:serine/threonine-protein kinase n=1 Tax=Hyalangium gracile TaxID=394092 RepID=UPI001CC99E15|nr:serine/threonine-protein kinase [Hyalangium gracile]
MGGSTLPLAPDAFSGRKLGKYEVLCRLSTGGMAEIFLASQRGLAGFRKLVVLKQILPDIAGEEEFVQMFLDEARVTAAFNHPHIAQVYDLDVAEGELFLAMEFVPGATLVEVAKACRAANEPIPVGFSLEAVRDTALALHYAHTFTDPLGRPSPVIHRDVAEKNIMVTYEGVTKLLDFGIAKNLARKGRTQIGMVKGTSGYMSPEQILGEPLDSRSDLFSLGVVLHECLTGLRLFHSKTPEAGAGAVLQGQVPPPSRANKAIPPELDAIVLKALARKREDRYATTLEFARALERAVGPLIWHPEQSGELIRRLFSDRREQTRQLLMAGKVMSGDTTGEVNLAQILSPPAPPEPPPPPADPVSATRLPLITPALPAAGRPGAPSQTGLPSVKAAAPAPPPPPAQEPLLKPLPPPKEAPPRRITSASVTVAPPEVATRRPVFEPLPQKRTSTLASSALTLPPPPPREDTGRTNSSAETIPAPSPPPARQSSPRVAPLPPPVDPDEDDDDSHPALRTIMERVDLNAMGTFPHADSPVAKGAPVPDTADDEHTPAVKHNGGRRSPTSSERIPQPPSNVGARPSRRRVPTPPPPRQESDFEITTRPVRALRVEEEEPQSDTNETLIPEGEEGHTLLTSPVMALPAKKKNGAWVMLAVALLLLGAVVTVVALGWDGGRLSGLLGLRSSPAASAVATSVPLKPPPAPPTQPTEPVAKAPAPAPEPAPPTPAQPTTTAEPATPTPPAEATPPATPPDTAPQEPAVAETTPPEEKIEAATAKSEEVLTAEADTTKKSRPATNKRTRRDAKPGASEDEDASADDAAAAAPAPGGNGTLTLVTTPYAKVYLGRRYLGDTPLFKLSLPTGKQTLKLVDASGRSLRLPVEIKPGETTALKLSLDELDAN